jgi:hypothetical protein
VCERGGGKERKREKVRKRDGARERERTSVSYLLQVHQGSVDTYLEDIILHSVESTADHQAREEIRQQADSINKIAHDFEHTYVE